MTHEHINPAFDEAMTNMENSLVKVEDAVAKQIASIHTAFFEMDAERARKVYKKDKKLNALSKDAEEAITTVLAKYQPMAHDLRRTIGTLKMAIEYERAGDYIKHLAKSVVKMGMYENTLQAFPTLRDLLETVEKMLAQFLQARRNNDLDAAIRVWVMDQKVDDLCAEAVREVMSNRDTANVHSVLHSISAAKNMERVGDKIKNLVEIFYYQHTGEELDIES